MLCYRVRSLFGLAFELCFTSVCYFDDFHTAFLHAQMSQDGFHPCWCIERLDDEGIFVVARSAYDDMIVYNTLNPHSIKVSDYE